MKLRLSAAVVFLLCVASAFGQDTTFNYTPAAEVFGGFSLHRTQFGSEMRNAPGFDFSFGYNAAKYLRLLADFGGQYHGTQLFLFDERVSTSNYQVLFGPELVGRNRSRYTPFMHGMFGWVTRRYNVPNGLLNCNGDQRFGAWSCRRRRARRCCHAHALRPGDPVRLHPLAHGPEPAELRQHRPHGFPAHHLVAEELSLQLRRGVAAWRPQRKEVLKRGRLQYRD
jgi:hypothetical protein